MINFLDKKYSKKEEPTTTKDDKEKETAEVKEDNSTGLEAIKSLDISDLKNDQLNYYLKNFHLSTKKPLKALSVEEKRLILTTIRDGSELPSIKPMSKETIESNRKVIRTINLPSVNKDVNGVYSEIEESLLESEVISIDGPLVNGVPDKVVDDGYYKLKKGDKEEVFVTGERLRGILKLEAKQDSIDESSNLNIDDLLIDFPQLKEINVEKEDITISNGKINIDIDGLGDSLILEKKGDKFKITDNGSELSDIIIDITDITEAIIFLNKIVQGDLLHKAYRIRQKIGDTKDSAYEEITKYIDKIKSPSTLADFKKSVKSLEDLIK